MRLHEIVRGNSPKDFLHSENVSQEYSKGIRLACPMIGSLGGLGGREVRFVDDRARTTSEAANAVAPTYKTVRESIDMGLDKDQTQCTAFFSLRFLYIRSVGP